MTGTTSRGSTALDARDLYRFFRTGDGSQTVALREVSLSVESGEMVAVVGPSGSGKSTLLACLAGLDVPDAGSITVAGHVVTGSTETRRARLRAQHIGTLLQVGNLIEHLTVAQNLTLAQRLVGRADRNRSQQLVAELGIAAQAHQYPSQLSGGEAARAGLAVALANAPAVVVADEPTGELDSATESVVLELLARAADAGVAVVVASHSSQVADLADRSLTLHDGRVVATVPVSSAVPSAPCEAPW